MNYLNNKEFLQKILDYQKLIKPYVEKGLVPPQMPDAIGRDIIRLCEGVAMNRWFINYTYNDELKMDAIERCIYALTKFDVTKTTNPFGYFTQVAWHAMQKRINDERKQSYVKHKNYRSRQSGLEHPYWDAIHDIDPETCELSDKVIEEFEEREKKKLTKSPKKPKKKN